MSKRQRTSKKRFLSSKQGLLFLLFAAVIWTLSALSETYTTTVPVQFKFEVDSKLYVLSRASVEVPARVSSTGFSILYRRLFPRSVMLSILELPITNTEKPSVSADYLLSKYKQVYSSSNQITGFTYKNIQLPLTQAIRKSFLPTLKALPRFEDGYQLVSPLKFEIDSVFAFGRKTALDQLHEAVFEISSKKPLRSSFTIEATLIDSLANMASWSTTTVNVSGIVDRYSDVSIALPVTIQGLPENTDITFTPKMVEVKFAAPLGLIRSIDASVLSAIAVFDTTSLRELSVEIMGLPDEAKHLSVSPPNVSCFIVE